MKFSAKKASLLIIGLFALGMSAAQVIKVEDANAAGNVTIRAVQTPEYTGTIYERSIPSSKLSSLFDTPATTEEWPGGGCKDGEDLCGKKCGPNNNQQCNADQCNKKIAAFCKKNEGKDYCGTYEGGTAQGTNKGKCRKSGTSAELEVDAIDSVVLRRY